MGLFGRKTSKEQAQPESFAEENLQLNDSQLRALALSAILSLQYEVNPLTIGVGMNKVAARQALYDRFYTGNAKTVIKDINSQLEAAQESGLLTRKDVKWVKKPEKYEERLSTYHFLKPGQSLWDTNIAGYFCANVVFEARLAYDSGFLNANEVLEYSSRAYAIACTKYDNWMDFGNSYVIGRTLYDDDNNYTYAFRDYMDMVIDPSGDAGQIYDAPDGNKKIWNQIPFK